MERMQTKISADGQIRWGDVFLLGSCVGNLELPREQKETNYDETKSWAQTQTAAASGGPRGLLTLVLSKIHTFTGWWLALGNPGTRFLLDNSKKSHAQNDDPLQPTAATVIDGHVAINRSNVATSPSNPCALLLCVTLPLSRYCSLSLSPEYCSGADGESGTRAGNGS